MKAHSITVTAPKGTDEDDRLRVIAKAKSDLRALGAVAFTVVESEAKNGDYVAEITGESE